MIETLTILAVVCAVQAVCLPVLLYWALKSEGRFGAIERRADRAEADAKEAHSDKLRADAQARQRSGRRSLLATGPSTWYSEPQVQRKSLLGA